MCVCAFDSLCRCFIIHPCTRLCEHLDMAALARSNMLYNCVVVLMWCMSIQSVHVLVGEVPGGSSNDNLLMIMHVYTHCKYQNST